MKTISAYFFRNAIDFLFRKKRYEFVISRIGVSLVCVAFVEKYLISVKFRSEEIGFQLDWLPNGESGILSFLCFSFGFVFIALGVLLVSLNEHRERKENGKKVAIAIEQRGLNKPIGSPLSEKVKLITKLRTEALILDHSAFIRNSIVTDPEAALKEISTIGHDLKRKIGHQAISDVHFFYGGISPVPLTFAAGYLCDDEFMIKILDWDRFSSQWRELDSENSDLEIFTAGTENLTDDSEDVAVVVEVSYQIDDEDIFGSIGNVPVVRCGVEDATPDTHWSMHLQQNIGRIFLQTLAKIARRQYKRVHIFIAAPNSMVFSLGRAYDRNLLPQALIYQYQKGSSPRYPWAVLLPEQGKDKLSVIYR